MKATILTTVFAAFVLSINVNAQDVKTYSNVESNELGISKEFISVDSETLAPLTKEFYSYDAEGKMVEKVISKWGGSDAGWINTSKYEYTYGDTNSDLVTLVAYTKWDKTNKDWSEESEFLVNIYDEDSNYMATLHNK